ncbi:LrgB family protein [Paenibacillus sp. LHD-117]|uniref:LrgB family protein n=1 Tax=Paenibacillus sp. LHD-117 TaxID=3071412 RepID=UPI0027DFEDC0|nr:LrgB family protein [Paenibacillus sp. LHD-117]MDQ6423498.1 LrgB family protein [Paenibacillus sp. LHD-117]
MMRIDPLLHNPLFGMALTIVLYSSAIWLRKKIRWLHPLIAASAIIIVILEASGISYDTYRMGADVISWALGPATVALAVPLYKHAALIRSKLAPVLTSITVGAVISAATTACILYLSGASADLLFSAVAKSSSAPFSMAVAERQGGIPELAAALSVMTGLFGSLAGPLFLRMCGIRDDLSIGAAIGTSSHGIGTARLMACSETQGSVSGFAMAAAGIVTTMMMMFY